jgi:hypothetical protein
VFVVRQCVFRRAAVPALLVGVIVLAAGCGQKASESGPQPQGSSPKGPPQPAPVEVKVVKADRMEKELADRRGKIVILDEWALW